MAGYLARRALFGFVVMLAVTCTLFFVTHLVADPARQYLGTNATPESLTALRHNLGLDRTLLHQFTDFIKGAGHLDFGESLWRKVPAMDLLREALPSTLRLVGISLVLSVVVGGLLGVAAALRPGTAIDRSVVSVSLFGVSLPQFWLGAILILVVAVHLHWVPTSGEGSWKQLVLPSLTLAAPNIGATAQLTRATFVQELSSPYIAAARAKGLSTPYIVVRHALRNASVPIVTLVSYQVAAALAGQTVIVETVFAWPGAGRLAIQAVQQQDLALLQAIVFSVAALVVSINILADVIYRLIDPRINASVARTA